MRITGGKVDDYIIMMLDFRNKGESPLTMVDYLEGVLEDFLEVITGRISSPAASRLFEVKPEDERKILERERETAFHHMVTQLLFFMSRSR